MTRKEEYALWRAILNMNPRNFNLPPGVTKDDVDPPEHDADEQDREADAADHERDIGVADNL